MSNPLLSYLYKLYRANEHLESLDQELIAFLQPDSYEIVTKFEDERDIAGEDRVRGTLRRRVIFKREPPLLVWGNIIGDVIQNLRSALDHVIFAISFSRAPSEFRDDRTTEFPICDDPNTFHRPRRRNRPPLYEIRGIPPDAQAVVEGLQPYHRGKGYLSDDPLWILREMSNIDKHRNIHVTAWSAHTISLDITDIAPRVRIHSHRVRLPGVIESGTVIAEIDITTPRLSKGAMYVEKEFYFTVAFGQGTPLVGQPANVALGELGLYVEGIVEALGRFVVE